MSIYTKLKKGTYPNINFQNIQSIICCGDANVYWITCRVIITLKSTGASDLDIEDYKMNSTSNDYQHFIVSSVKWLDRFGYEDYSK